MNLFILTFFVALTQGHNVYEKEHLLLMKNYENLQWPTTYKIQATKLSLNSGLIEDITAWRTNDSSRIDYNKGAVKSIVLSKVDGEDNGASFEIHPETSYSGISTLICHKMTSGLVNLGDILPPIETYDFESIGNETIIEKETEKFVYTYTDISEDVDNRMTIWAEFVKLDYEDVWIPVRYEVKEYKLSLGSLKSHVIWDFFDFEEHFDDDVFGVEQYSCSNESTTVKLEKDSEAVTEYLMFIEPEKEEHVDHVFKTFRNKHNRIYADHKEHSMRRSIFKNSMRLISSTNRRNLGYKLAVNKFADRTPEEMKRYMGLMKRPEGKVGSVPFPYDDAKLKEMAENLPSEYDLRLYGLISSVKNQEDCGSCWTFGTTSAVEGALARNNGGRLLSLSNQALIDCAWPYGAAGCEGGSDNAAYEWMIKYGLPTVEEYGSYSNKDGFCNILNMTEKYPIRGYTDVTPFNVEALKVALINHGPLSVSVEVTMRFSLYSGGIYYEKDCGPSGLNHEVTLVGYGQRDDEDFWILKNSWGTDWGEAGFMLISTRDNDCGVATEPTYVVF